MIFCSSGCRKICGNCQSSSNEISGKPQQGRLEGGIQLVSPEGRSIKKAVVTEDSNASERFSTALSVLALVCYNNKHRDIDYIPENVISSSAAPHKHKQTGQKSKTSEVTLLLYFSVGCSLSLQERGRTELVLRPITLQGSFTAS